MPKAEDVLSFELPPLKVPGGSTLPDSLSIRVRVTTPPANQTVEPQ